MAALSLYARSGAGTTASAVFAVKNRVILGVLTSSFLLFLFFTDVGVVTSDPLRFEFGVVP